MRVYKEGGMTIIEDDNGQVFQGATTCRINNNLTATYFVDGDEVQTTRFANIFPKTGSTPIGTDNATVIAYNEENLVFSTATGGSVASDLAIGDPVNGGTTNNLLRVVSGSLLGQVDPATLVIPTTGVAVSDVASPTGNLAQSQKGVFDYAQSKAVLNQLIDDIDQNVRTVFNGSTTIGTMATPLVISSVGDFIEFELKCNLFNTTTQRGIMGQVGVSNSSIGIGTASGNLRMRSTSGAWFNSTNILNDNLTTSERPIIRVENVAGVWKSYKNGVFQKNLTEGGTSFTLSAFGHAYDTADRFNGELSKVRGKAQGVDFDFGSLINSPLVTFTNATADMGADGFLTTTQTANLADTLVDYAPCFYQSIFISGGTVFSHFMVYLKMKGKTTYMGVKIEKRVSALVKQDIYKILNAFEFTYNPTTNAMTQVGTHYLIADGESEFVYKINGSLGGQFTGGGHGYETFSKIQFLADGIPLQIASAIPLTRCEMFEYIQQSTTWNALNDTQADGVHIKHTRFDPENTTIMTRNIMTWSRSITLELWYHGIFCLGKGCATAVRNEFYDELSTPATTPEVNPAFQSTRAFELIGHNTTTGCAGRVKSKIMRPLTMADELTSKYFLAVRVNDTKFYNEVSNRTVSNGDVWENVQISEFSKL